MDKPEGYVDIRVCYPSFEVTVLDSQNATEEIRRSIKRLAKVGFKMAEVKIKKGLSTSCSDVHDAELYSGDIVQSVIDNRSVFTIGFGKHLAYCDLDKAWVRNVGFYAEDKNGYRYPLGETEKWAEKVGTIYDEKIENN